MPAVLSKQHSLIDKINILVRDTHTYNIKCCEGIANDKIIYEYLYRKARDHPEMLFNEFVKYVIGQPLARQLRSWVSQKL